MSATQTCAAAVQTAGGQGSCPFFRRLLAEVDEGIVAGGATEVASIIAEPMQTRAAASCRYPRPGRGFGRCRTRTGSSSGPTR